jgi:hypothetical protein
MAHDLNVYLYLKLRLSSQAKGLDDGSIPFHVIMFDIIQESSTPAYHHQQTSSGVMVFFVDLEMLRQISDAMRQQPDLYFRGAGVAFVRFETVDEFFLIFGC